jgi:hypothetical protein
VAVVGGALAGHLDPTSVSPTTTPLVVPPLSLLPTICVLAAALPAFATPRPAPRLAMA